jgi:biotin synthesis protein BioG
MQHYLINKNSDNLVIFFTGWGCDEYEFEHLESNFDVLILYDYMDLNLDFDFSKYKKIDLLAFSAGVFVASIMKFDFTINHKIAISGNPYLFDEKFGLSKEIQNILSNITEETANDFARNYLVKTDEEWQKFHNSKRTLESCKAEFKSLKTLYDANKQNIKDFYDSAIIGEEDPIFNVTTQKGFYKDRLTVIKNARHNLFFKIDNYEQILVAAKNFI